MKRCGKKKKRTMLLGVVSLTLMLGLGLVGCQAGSGESADTSADTSTGASSDTNTGASASELEELREQIESLQSQVEEQEALIESANAAQSGTTGEEGQSETSWQSETAAGETTAASTSAPSTAASIAAPTTAPSTTAAPTTAAPTVAPTTAASSNSTGNLARYEELKAQVDAFVQEAAIVEASSGRDMDEFFSLKGEAETIDNALELYEDGLESQYRQGQISLEDYRQLERDAESLENQLDRAEDSLEYAYGMD